MKRISIILIFLISIVLIFKYIPLFHNLLINSGLVEEKIYISGTGSMYPTFPKGEGKDDIMKAQETVAWPYMRRFPGGISLFDFNFLGYALKHGDIIDFENEKTDEISQKQYGRSAGFVKRVIALPTDTIEIRDGFVYLNGKLLREPYTASSRSTFGGDFLSDCHRLTIPKGDVFVMGDNRKASLDSRFTLGLVPISDIRHVLPWQSQTPYEKNWRQADNDSANALKPTLDSLDFINLLNKKREESNILDLKYNNLLSKSSYSRANIMLKTDDFSLEASKSGYTLEKSVSESGYSNIIYAEAVVKGYYDAGELVDNILQFPETKKLLLSKDYQDIGLSALVGDVSNCPVQAIVLHLGGYVPPNYSKDIIDSWQKLYDNIVAVIPSWENLKGNPSVDQDVLNQLLNSLYTRRSNLEKILYKLKSNLWLSKEEKNTLENDKNLSQAEEDLINKLKK